MKPWARLRFFGGVFGLALILVRRARRTTAIPFGPWMILGAWLVTVPAAAGLAALLVWIGRLL